MQQFGVIARRQLLACGFGPDRVKSWIRSGRLHPRHPGVYALGRRELSTEGELAAALLFAGPGAALGGLTALWWLELLGRRPAAIHVDAPGDAASRPGLRIRHPRQVPRDLHRDLPVTPLPQALLAAAGSLSHDSLRLVLARAEFNGLLDLRSLHAAVGPGRAGSRALRAAIRTHLPQLAACASRLEVDFLLLCERHGIELPEVNPRIGRYRPDMLWRSHGLIAELDGSQAHHSPAQKAADERRAADLTRRGFTIIRFTWDDVHSRAHAVAAELRAHLG